MTSQRGTRAVVEDRSAAECEDSVVLGESLEEGQQNRIVRVGDREVMVSIGLGGLRELVLDAVTGTLDRTPEALTEELMRFLDHGLLVADRAGRVPGRG